MSRYSKAIAAAVGAVAQALTLGLLPDEVGKWTAVVVAFLTIAGVYVAPKNTPTPLDYPPVA